MQTLHLTNYVVNSIPNSNQLLNAAQIYPLMKAKTLLLLVQSNSGADQGIFNGGDWLVLVIPY